MRTVAYCDSSVREACYVISTGQVSTKHLVTYPERVTTNVGEYLALNHLLESLELGGYKDVDIFSDSLLVVNQVSGLWRTRDPKLLPLRDRARQILKKTNSTLSWIPREQNEAGIILEGRTPSK